MRYRVYNDNVHELRERFQGREICLAPGEYVEMNRDEMVLYKGQFKTPVIVNGVADPRSFKKLRIEPITADEPKSEAVTGSKDQKHICQKCGFEAKNKAGLSAHIRNSHASSMLDEDAKKELMEHVS